MSEQVISFRCYIILHFRITMFAIGASLLFFYFRTIEIYFTI